MVDHTFGESLFVNIGEGDLSFEAFLYFVLEALYKETEISVVILFHVVLLVAGHVFFENCQHFLTLNLVLLPTNFHRHIQLFLPTINNHLFQPRSLHQRMFLHRPFSLKPIQQVIRVDLVLLVQAVVVTVHFHFILQDHLQVAGFCLPDDWVLADCSLQKSEHSVDSVLEI
jgi:hypothetical protein